MEFPHIQAPCVRHSACQPGARPAMKNSRCHKDPPETLEECDGSIHLGTIFKGRMTWRGRTTMDKWCSISRIDGPHLRNAWLEFQSLVITIPVVCGPNLLFYLFLFKISISCVVLIPCFVEHHHYTQCFVAHNPFLLLEERDYFFAALWKFDAYSYGKLPCL